MIVGRIAPFYGIDRSVENSAGIDRKFRSYMNDQIILFAGIYDLHLNGCRFRAGGNFCRSVARISHSPAAFGIKRRLVKHQLIKLFTFSSDSTVPSSEEHTYELQSLMRNTHAVFCLKKKNQNI